jgi:hypothetical protein
MVAQLNAGAISPCRCNHFSHLNSFQTLLAEAKVIIESWRQHYNAVRPHSSLGYLTPNQFMAQRNAAPRHATGRVAAVSGPSRPGPLHHLLPEEQMHEARDAVSS